MSLGYAYNTNGCAHHRLDDALAMIAEAGYEGVALTVDWQHFDPFAPRFLERAEALSRRLRELGLDVVMETGTRFTLDPRKKHEPTLISPEPEGRRRRAEYLKRCIDLCAICGGEAVSFWSGVPRPGVSAAEAWRWLQEGVFEVLEHARAAKVEAAFEPEPGMLVETVDDWRRMAETPGLPVPLFMALDVGHLLVTGEREPAAAVREFAAHLGTVSIEDMKRRVHEHLPFGRGDLDVRPVLRALREIHFERLVCVEMSRESHRADEAIGEAIAYLKLVEAEI